MSSKDPKKKNGRLFKFLSKDSPMESYGMLDSFERNKEIYLSKTEFIQCEIVTDEVKRGECSKKVWRLKNITNKTNLEALVSSSSCLFEFGEGVNKIQLRFFLKLELQRDRSKKQFSLMCGVLTGGEGKQLAFAVKVDKLSQNLYLEHNIVNERAIIINSEADRKGTIVSSVFCGGLIYNTEQCLQPMNELNFGFTVTQLQCTGEGRYGEPKSFLSKPESSGSS